MVRDVARRLDLDLIRSGSSLSVVAEENIVGQWDKFRLDQVVNNLLSNAIKFGLGKPVEILTRARSGRAFLIVKDQGIGIEPGVLPRLFKPFERGVSERHYGGLGLGLHIVKTIAEAMAGTVSAESSPETGTVFTVEFPHRRGGLMSPGDRILVVEDDEDIREVMRDVLAAEGFNVDVAKDGIDALGKLELEARPPLILLDMMMPRMDGETFLQALRGNPALADASVVVISGNAAARERAGKHRAVGCLVKPFELEELLGLFAGSPAQNIIRSTGPYWDKTRSGTRRRAAEPRDPVAGGDQYLAAFRPRATTTW